MNFQNMQIFQSHLIQNKYSLKIKKQQFIILFLYIFLHPGIFFSIFLLTIYNQRFAIQKYGRLLTQILLNERIWFKRITGKIVKKMKEEIISKELLEILVCPLCKADVNLTEYQSGKHGLKCSKCQRIYPIEDGIPVMLIDEAIQQDQYLSKVDL